MCIGLHGRFQMIQVFLEIRKYVPDITPQHIWDHLGCLYDLSALVKGTMIPSQYLLFKQNENAESPLEEPPFVAEKEEYKAFALPKDQFGSEIEKRGGKLVTVALGIEPDYVQEATPRKGRDRKRKR